MKLYHAHACSIAEGNCEPLDLSRNNVLIISHLLKVDYDMVQP